MEESAAVRLGRLVRERRKYLKLTQADVQAAGGPSTATLRLIEGGKHTDFRDGTGAALEKVLRWEVGSIDAVLSGRDPAEIEHRLGRGLASLIPSERDEPNIEDPLVRLLIDLAIDADQVDTTASGLPFEPESVDELVDEVDSLLIDIDKLTQRIHDEALTAVGGDLEVLKQLKAEVIKVRRNRRLGRGRDQTELFDHMLDIAKQAHLEGVSEAEMRRRLNQEFDADSPRPELDTHRAAAASEAARPDVAWRPSDETDVDPAAGSGGILRAARGAKQPPEGRLRRDAHDAVENQDAP